MAEQTQTPKANKFVTVACKMPGGMRLQLHAPTKDTEPVMGGGRREITTYQPVGEAVTVAGCAEPVGGPPTRKLIRGGYALTRNVPADFWEQWLEQNKDAPYVKNGIIFAMPNRDAAEARAEEQQEIRSGMEPLNPEFTVGKDGKIVPSDPRYPVSVNPNLTALHTGEKAA